MNHFSMSDVNIFIQTIIDHNLASKVNAKTSENVFNALKWTGRASCKLATQIWDELVLTFITHGEKISVSWQLKWRKWTNDKNFRNKWSNLDWKVPHNIMVRL